MEVFRITRSEWADQLSASGVAGRWNRGQQYVIYTGSSRSLATLELVVHRSAIKPSFLYNVLVISIADKPALFHQITEDELPANWRFETTYGRLQYLGSEWYQSNQSLVLKVPSAVIPMEHNYIINMHHPDYNDENVMLVRNEAFFWDNRLVK